MHETEIKISISINIKWCFISSVSYKSHYDSCSCLNRKTKTIIAKKKKKKNVFIWGAKKTFFSSLLLKIV